jgi:hypothetical protein
VEKKKTSPALSRARQEKFQKKWNARFFTTTGNDKYGVYRKLWRLGADFEHIDTLYRFFEGGYRGGEWARRFAIAKAEKIKRELENASSQPLVPDHWESLTRRIFLDSGRKSDEAYNPPATHPAQIRKKAKELIARKIEEEGLNVSESQRKAWEKETARIYYSCRVKGQEEARHKQRETDIRSLRKEGKPLAALFLKYLYPVVAHDVGRKSDVWGSFFLLASSEYLRRKTGKPCYVLCARLLKALRRTRSDDLRSNATVRVTKLKRAFPDWRSDLRILNKALLKSQR